MHIDYSQFCVFANEAKPDHIQEAKSFANKLQINFYTGSAFKNPKHLEEPVRQYPYIIYFDGLNVSVVQTAKGAPGPVTASFLKGKTLHRLKYGGGKGQMIAKAVGLGKASNIKVLDATAGLGGDAFVLATLGCDVTLLERSPIVSVLLSSAINESLCDSENEDGALLAEIVERMKLIEANSIDWLRAQGEAVADVIYLDPMYPEREKSSQVKKEMQLFHNVVGSDMDDAELLEEALRKAKFRVVVKRPRKGVTVKGPAPSLQLTGKSCRYDIYTIKAFGKTEL